MMLASLWAALRNLADGALLPCLLKSVALTLLLFILLLVLGDWAVSALPRLGWPWINQLLEWLVPVLTVLAFLLLGAPVAGLFATLFLEDVAARIEARDYPADPPAPGMGLWAGLKASFALMLALVAAALLLVPLNLFLPGLAWVAVLAVNGWLLGREYFFMVGLRHRGPQQVKNLWRRASPRLTLAGIIVAVMTMIPLVNLVAPLFATALMVHLFKRIEKREAACV